MRLFVALELPPGARDALGEWAAELELPWLRPVAAESLHLTLCFIGERPDPDPVAAAVSAALDGVVLPAEPLDVIGMRWLPRRPPRVLAVELDDPGGRVAAVAGAVHDAVGVIQEHRPFLPHISVGRVRGTASRPPAITPPAVGRCVPGPVTLIRSHLGGGPARYERLASWPIR